MDLQEKIKTAMIAAMKAKQELRLSTLRMVRSALKNTEIEKKAALKDIDVISVLRKLLKQRQDSIESFEKAGRMELAAREKQELAVLEEFLPEPLSEKQLLAIIDETAKELNAETIRDMGKLIKAVMEKAKGQADGKQVSQLVKQKLQ